MSNRFFSLWVLRMLTAIVFFMAPVGVAAAPWDHVTGLERAADAIFQPDIEIMVGYIIYAALGVIGVVFLALIVYGGTLWMTSMGDEKKITTARTYLFHSVLGLIIVLASFAITKFVIEVLASKTLR